MTADPRPVFVLLLLQLLCLLGLMGWWCSQPAPERLARLARVMVREHVATLPPAGMLAQVEWLYTHRLARLTGMVGVLVVAGVIGIGEGIARRKRDVMGGFLYKWWVMGSMGVGLTPGVGVAYLLVPWPLPLWWVAGGLACLVMVILFALCAGRPYVA